MTADQVIRLLKLQKHPKEGGFFIETYRSRATIAAEHLPPGYVGDRNLGTAIYYLLTAETFSALHRLPGDEIFHHYLGDGVEMLLLHPDGRDEAIHLGHDLAAGDRPQVAVPGNTWQGSRLVPGGSFALLGCTMSPGFDYADYQHGRRDDLTKRYPRCAAKITELTT